MFVLQAAITTMKNWSDDNIFKSDTKGQGQLPQGSKGMDEVLTDL